MPGDGAVGAIIGAGAVLGAVYLITRSRTAHAASRSPRESVPASGSSAFPYLVERWRRPVEARAEGLPVNGILEWIRIESGGDMCSIGSPYEVGIFQLMFPDDAKYGATLEGLRAICAQSKKQNPRDISWMTEADLDMEVGAGIRKILAARDTVRRVLGKSGVHWDEASFDFGSAIKQIHAAPAVITELVPKIAAQGGPPSSWDELRQRVNAFPIDQMGSGLRSLALARSKYGLKNRLEDTLRNAEFVGRAWARGA